MAKQDNYLNRILEANKGRIVVSSWTYNNPELYKQILDRATQHINKSIKQTKDGQWKVKTGHPSICQIPSLYAKHPNVNFPMFGARNYTIVGLNRDEVIAAAIDASIQPFELFDKSVI